MSPTSTNPQIIPSEEQNWFTQSFVDPNGRVFEWRGDIYRVLEPSYAARWQELTVQGIIPGLIRDGLLVETELTSLITQSGKAVLHHRRIPIVSYCYEWLPGMLRDAALLTLDLCIRLAERGLTLQDGHPWNVLFEGTKPLYVDASSVVSATDDILWAPYQQFCNFFLFPLYVYAAGHDRLPRWLLRDYLAGVTDDDLLSALPLSFKLCHPCRTLSVAVPKFANKLFGCLPEELQQRFFTISKNANSGPGNVKLKLRFLSSLRKDIETLKLPGASSDWTGYYRNNDENYFGTSACPADWRQKQEAVNNILAELKPHDVLDIGANTGCYAKMAAAAGARVTACDTDVPAITQCYDEARKDRSNILPLVVNVFSDSPTPGPGGATCPAPLNRLRSEFVMGLAVIHHVVAMQRIPVVRIVDMIAALSVRWLLLEYVPPLKRRIGASPIPGMDDFTVETLEQGLRERFKTIRSLPSYPNERKLFLCEK